MVEICNCNCLPVVPLADLAAPQANPATCAWLDDAADRDTLRALRMSACGDFAAKADPRGSNESAMSAESSMISAPSHSCVRAE